MDTKAITAELTRHVPGNHALAATPDARRRAGVSGMHSLYSDIGWLIAERFSALENRERVFELIEMGLCNGDGKLNDAVSTGLIEAMISRASWHPARWRQISSHFGPLSAACVQR